MYIVHVKDVWHVDVFNENLIMFYNFKLSTRGWMCTVSQEDLLWNSEILLGLKRMEVIPPYAFLKGERR